MSNLTEMKSILDRQVKGVEGANVGVTNPSDGNYYTVEGSADSPFDSNDHMVDLMTKDILSENSGITHQKSPNTSPHQDLDGELGPQSQLPTAQASQKHIDSLQSVPGGDSNSPFQDLDGQKGPIFGDASGEGKQLGGKDLHESLLTKHYTYTHGGDSTTILIKKTGEGGNFDLDGTDEGNGYFHGIANPGREQGKQLGGKDLHESLLTKHYTYQHGGFSTTILQRKSGIDGGELDLDGTSNGNGYFHGIANPGREQGKQLGGKDLHERMLTNPYTYNHGGFSTTVGPSPGPSGHSTFQDLDGVLPFANKPLGQFGGPYKNGKGPSDGHY